MASSRLRYQLSVADLPGRCYRVRLSVDGPFEGHLVVRMPSWVPGSYLMREYAGHLQWLRATAGGEALDTRKQDKHSWRIGAAGHDRVEVEYQLYAPDRSVRSNDLSDEGGFVHPAATWLQVDGRTDEPCEVDLLPPDGWRVACALPGEGNTLTAASYDELLDSPLAMGPGERHAFDLDGTRHELFVVGPPTLDTGRALEDFRRICQQEAQLFGGLPTRRYVFLLLLTASGGGGLEYSNSCALAWPARRLRPDKEYHRFLTLVAHEYFHLWNVKRIRPEVLARYDYFREVHTRLLWVFEGITSYYDEMTPVRAGCYGPERLLEFLVERVRRERQRPGRHVQSLADSSFDTWIKLYRPTPDTPNSTVSYYEKGMLVAMLLDLHLRRATGDERSLDDVMRLAWERAQAGQGIPEDGYAALVQEATGVDTTRFLAEHVDGTGELDYDAALAHVGLRLRPKKRDEADLGAWIGANIQATDGESKLATVFTGGPAHTAGLMDGDVVVALDGLRVRADLVDQLKLFRPGERATVDVFRSDRLVHAELEFAEDPAPALELVPRGDVPDERRGSFEHWTQRQWDEAFGKAAGD